MKTYKVMIHDWRHFGKDSLAKWAAAIKNSILQYPKNLTIKELANELVDGHTVIMGHLEYSEEELIAIKTGKKIGASSRHWKNQQIFAVDIDNEHDIVIDGKKKRVRTEGEQYITIDGAINMCKSKGAEPAFIYTTYSHVKDHHRFRVVFVMSKETASIKKRQAVLASIFEVFNVNGESLVDSKCSDPARLFYPGKELVHTNYGSIIDPDALIKKLPPTFNKEELEKEVELSNAPLPPVKNKVVTLLRQNKLEQAKKEVAVSLRGAPEPYNTWLREPLAKVGIIIYYKIIKDYYPDFSQATSTPVFIRHPEDYYEIAQRFPLHLLLGLPFEEHFRCILPGHHDNDASARIEKKHGTEEYIYHCYGCMETMKYYDIFSLLENITGWSHNQAKRFINDLLGIEFETEWQIDKKKEISDYQDFLMGEQIEKRFPFLYKELTVSNSLGVLYFLLGESRRLMYDRSMTEKDMPVFFISISRLSRKMSDMGMGKGTSPSSLQRKIKFLTKLRLVDVVVDEELPKAFIRESHTRRIQKGYRYRVNYFSVPEFSLSIFENAELIAKEFKEKNMKRSYYSRQMELWTNGKEAADEQYVQDTNVLKSKKTLEFYVKYKKVATDLMQKQGYVTEKEIMNSHSIRGLRKRKELSATVLPQLLQEKNLQITRYSKYYKEKFGITQDVLKFGISKIIVREEDMPPEK